MSGPGNAIPNRMECATPTSTHHTNQGERSCSIFFFPFNPQWEKQTAVAKALLPTLRQELVHLNLKEVIQRPRESQFRSTCGEWEPFIPTLCGEMLNYIATDTCMTSIFSSSWLCRQCGRESCPD